VMACPGPARFARLTSKDKESLDGQNHVQLGKFRFTTRGNFCRSWCWMAVCNDDGFWSGPCTRPENLGSDGCLVDVLCARSSILDYVQMAKSRRHNLMGHCRDELCVSVGQFCGFSCLRSRSYRGIDRYRDSLAKRRILSDGGHSQVARMDMGQPTSCAKT
jgi:hypothetical protein